ncbi:MAG: hypothetical protein KJ600_03165 [Nanoarchaeota archaeon]|nr:hypothetical protein [Nanoarchaeota archaeon]MBU1103527.1 hypothetical protein [Nanoarchaeota archaeon]
MQDKIPNDAVVGTEYTVVIAFKEINTDLVSGGVTMGIAMDTTLPFVVVAEPEQPASSPPGNYTTLLISLLVIVILVVVIVLVIRKRKQNTFPTVAKK